MQIPLFRKYWRHAGPFSRFRPRVLVVVTEGEMDSRTRLWLTFVLDAGITFIEFVAAILTGSLVLWENFFAGLFDGVLISVNIWGNNRESAGRDKLALKIANASDILLATGFCIAVIYAVFHLDNTLSAPSTINGEHVLFMAFLAGAFNFGCARFLSKGGGHNVRSAGFKMKVGAGIAAATVLNGTLLLIYNQDWIDTTLTILVGCGVVLATVIRIQNERFLSSIERQLKLTFRSRETTISR